MEQPCANTKRSNQLSQDMYYSMLQLLYEDGLGTRRYEEEEQRSLTVAAAFKESILLLSKEGRE